MQASNRNKKLALSRVGLVLKGFNNQARSWRQSFSCPKNNVLHMVHEAACPAVPTITKAIPKFQQGIKRRKDKGQILHTGQNKDAGRSKPAKPCCSAGGHGRLTAQAQKRLLQTSLESPRRRVGCRFPWSRPALQTHQIRCLFLQAILLVNNVVRTNHLKLKLSCENSKHHYLELSFELNPSWEVSHRTVPPKHGAGTCPRVVLERTGATHRSTGAAVDHALTYRGQLQTPLQSR